MLINGAAVAEISAFDRGLHYGDGLFETLAVRHGRPCLWQRHMQRLQRGCDRLGLTAPDIAGLRREAQQEIADRNQGVLKILLTRGSGGRGYAPPRTVEPSRVLIAFPWPDHPPQWRASGVRVRLCDTRLGLNPLLGGLKHLNRLEQVVARSEWDDPKIAEGLMCDAANRVVEGTMSNLFLVRGHRLLTPDLSRCGVAGVVRELVIELATELGMEVSVTDLYPPDLNSAVAAFLTNSLIGLWPVRQIGDHSLAPGAIPLELVRRLADRVFSG